MAYTNKTIDLTGYNSKIENEGATSGGRLSATEYNTVVSALIEAQNNIQLLDQGVTIDLGGKQATLQLDQAPTSGSTNFLTSGTIYNALQAVQTTALARGAAPSTQLVSLGTYYCYTTAVESLVITLPAIVGATDIKGAVFFFQTGTLANGSGISITCEDTTVDILAYDGFEWADDTIYELNFIWNGTAWIMAYGIVAPGSILVEEESNE